MRGFLHRAYVVHCAGRACREMVSVAISDHSGHMTRRSAAHQLEDEGWRRPGRSCAGPWFCASCAEKHVHPGIYATAG